ncbi:MAG: hypothetical protein U0174_24520 [Polyangiaceae bacterium]
MAVRKASVKGSLTGHPGVEGGGRAASAALVLFDIATLYFVTRGRPPVGAPVTRKR